MVSLAESPQDPLSEQENTRLRELESIVEAGLESFLQVGAALAEIKADRLYRGTHGRWEDYCLDKWGLSLSRCNQIIQTTATYINLVAAIPQDTALLSEANEHALRPLSRLEPELQTVTWELIRKIEQRPTGITIQTVVDRIKTAIANGWEEHANTDTSNQEPDSANHNGSIPKGSSRRTSRIPERPSERLAGFCKLAAQMHLWDVEALALTDDGLCAQRHLKAARQLKTFCENFIRALEIRLSRARNLAAV